MSSRLARPHRRLLGSKRRASEAGFTLIELMLAVGVFMIGLLGIVAMQITAIKGVKLANELSLATNIATSKLEDLEVQNFDTLTDGSETYDRFADVGATPTYFTVTWTVTGDDPKDISVTTTWSLEGGENHSVQMQSRVTR